MIEDLLTLARQGEQVGEEESVDLAALAGNCWRNVETGEARLVTATDTLILADESRLQRLLENLVQNAVTHGGDRVTITIGDLEDGFSVEDDGPGILPADRDSVFDSGYSTMSDGTAFDLSIVEEIVEAHDWEIDVTASDDGGARFEVTGVETGAG